MKCKLFNFKIIFTLLCCVFFVNSFGQKIIKLKLKLKQPQITQAPRILYATTYSNKVNIIRWDSQNDANIDFYNVYRDSLKEPVPNTEINWIKIGRVVNKNFNYFIDNSSFPDKREYRYKISAVDRCGNEYFSKDIYSSIFLTLEATENSDILRWNKYKEAKGYNIFKGKTGEDKVSLFVSVPETDSVYTFVESSVEDSTYYKVEAVTDSAFYSWNDEKINVLSNCVSRITSNIKETLKPSSVTFFRKSDNLIQVIFPYFNIDTFDLMVFDLAGNKYFSGKVKNEHIEIPVHKKDVGTYLLYFESKKYKLSKKIILK